MNRPSLSYLITAANPTDHKRIRAICFDWFGTLMSGDGPQDVPVDLWLEVRPTIGARETLKALYDKVPLCLATNAMISTRPMIERALDQLQLLEFISEIFCFTELGYRKESLEFWRTVAQTLGLEPDEIAMIGDSLEQDVICPRSAGIFTVWFNENEGQPPPEVPVLTVTQLPDFVELIDQFLY